jgi:cell division protein FtsA
MWDDARQMNAIAAVLVLIAALALLWGGLAWVLRQPVFAFREVIVHGPLERVSAAHIEAAVREELTGTFFTMNLDRSRSALSRVPWVRTVALRRQWPQRLDVSIEEHAPLARWNDGSLVNVQGEVFVADYNGELPQFEGSRRIVAAGHGALSRLGRDARAAVARTGGHPALPARRVAARRPRPRGTAGDRVGARGSHGASRALRDRVRPHDRHARALRHPHRSCGPSISKRIRGPCARIPRAATEKDRNGRRASAKENGITMVKEAKNVIVGLDIGTSKIVAMVAEVAPDGAFNVIGLGTQPSRGLKRGVVVNIEATMASIQRVLEEAELMAECRITEVYTGIAGSHIKSLNSSGMVAIKEKEVTQADIDRVIETAKAIAIPNDQQILHILPQEFIIDGQEDVREPLGMSGVRLEVKVHIVTGAVSAVDNITKCVRRCGLVVNDVILQPLASSIAVLNDDEKELGICLMDIGGGTTDLAVFAGGAIRHTAVIPIAGDQVTNDIAMTLRTPTKEAEELKLRHGCALRQLADPNDIIEVPGVGERPPRKLSRQTLAEVIEPRIEELYSLVQAELRRSGFEELLSSGIVLTGGSALLAGMTELGEEVFHLPVRVGMPAYSGGLADVVRSPRYATAVGLLIEGRDQYMHLQESRARTTGIGGAAERMKQWFKANF